MEIAVTAPISGTVSEVFVARNVQVDGGAPLLRIEPRGDAPTDDDRRRADLVRRVGRPWPPSRRRRPSGRRRCGRSSSATTSRSAAARRAASALRGGWHRPTSWPRSCTPSPISAALAPERRPADDDDEQRAPREHFNHYLRSLDVEREGMPDVVRRAARPRRRPLRDRRASTSRPALEDALMRIFLAQQRHRRSTRRSSRRSWRAAPPADAGGADDRLRDALDRVIEATQRRHPAMASIARGVRHRLFDRPLIDRHRDEVADSDARPRARHRRSRMPEPTVDAAHEEALVACTLPLTPVFKAGGLFADDGPTRRRCSRC